MASTNLLQFSSISCTLLPHLSRHNSHSTNLRLYHSSSSSNNQSLSFKTLKGTPLLDVSAHAKRRFTSKEVEVASPSDLLFEAANKKIDTFDDNLKKLADEMFDIMYKERGIGDEIVLVNPRISKVSQKKVHFEEGCLSFPGIYADVERPESVKIDARDISGERFTISLSKLPARIFQHEFDHLEGTLFFDRMTEDVIDSIRAQLQVSLRKRSMKTRLGFQAPKVDNRRRLRVVAGFGKS
ncbi:hypothetical protein MKW92_005705 [Papaver armeniacum]|nr:hypothetical protein MKW92_005705 [Papaver armeniacum]